MKNKKNSTVLIAGGAGFIGSSIAKRFVAEGHGVIVIDGLLGRTGGRINNLKEIKRCIRFIHSTIEDVAGLRALVKSSDVIVDCMGLTAHHIGMKAPLYDLMLNARSHLVLVQHLVGCADKKVIYLGSRGQYGNPGMDRIDEDTVMEPNDIQGINKAAAEAYYRVYSKANGFNVVSIRLPNCFGYNQPMRGEDIGLIGSFIRDALNGKVIEVFGNRERNIVYAPDVASVVFKIAGKRFSGFNAFNLAGHRVAIKFIASTIVKIVGKGSVKTAKLPDQLKVIDIGGAKYDDTKLSKFLGDIPTTDITYAFKDTAEYFKKEARF
jgi:nucleoside-diphosphate-sugar epimerase